MAPGATLICSVVEPYLRSRSNDADGPPGHPAKLGRAVGDPAEGWVGQLHE
jgi:hypothetical protein